MLCVRVCPLACYHLWVAQVGKVGNKFEAANSLRRMPRAQKLRCCHASSPSTPRRDPPVGQFGTVSLLLPHTGHGGGGQRKSSNTWTWCMMVEYRWEHLGTIKPSPQNPVEIPAHEALTLLTAIIQRPPSTMYSRA